MELASYLAENGAWARGQESGLSSEGHCVCGGEVARRQGQQGRAPGKGRKGDSVSRSAVTFTSTQPERAHACVLLPLGLREGRRGHRGDT